MIVMNLYRISAGGIHAFCSHLIIDPDEESEVYFLSVCGYQPTVKGILANLLNRYEIEIQVLGKKYYLTRCNFSYTMEVKKLPSGYAHGVVFPTLALPKKTEGENNDFFIFTKKNYTPFGLFYRHLDEKTELPLHPSWDSWLWELFKREKDWLIELRTLIGSLRGYECSFDQDRLKELIAEAIRRKDPRVVDCMENKRR
jgi:hypothetical protein